MSAAVLELANATFVVVVPLIETAYEVEVVTEIEDGIVNVTRLVVPAMVVTADEGVVTAVPPAEGFSETVTAVACMVPVGKPEPVILITVMPGCPEVGDVVGESVTGVVWPIAKKGQNSAAAATAIGK